MIQKPNFTEVDVTQISAFIADKISPLVVPDMKIRNDRNGIQIDMVILTENYEKHMCLRFEFMLQGNFGMDVIVRLDDFKMNPTTYMRDLLQNINGIRFAGMQRRNGKEREIASVMKVMKGPQR